MEYFFRPSYRYNKNKHTSQMATLDLRKHLAIDLSSSSDDSNQESKEEPQLKKQVLIENTNKKSQSVLFFQQKTKTIASTIPVKKQVKNNSEKPYLKNIQPQSNLTKEQKSSCNIKYRSKPFRAMSSKGFKVGKEKQKQIWSEKKNNKQRSPFYAEDIQTQGIEEIKLDFIRTRRQQENKWKKKFFSVPANGNVKVENLNEKYNKQSQIQYDEKINETTHKLLCSQPLIVAENFVDVCDERNDRNQKQCQTEKDSSKFNDSKEFQEQGVSQVFKEQGISNTFQAPNIFRIAASQKNSYYLQSLYQRLLQNNHFTYEQYSQALRKFLLLPVPENCCFEFIVNVYRDIFKTQYEMLAQVNDKQILITSAANPNIGIDKSVFVFEQVGRKNQRQFIAQLQSNFIRDRYNLYGNDPDSKMGEVSQLMNININLSRTIYLPKISQKNELPFVSSSGKDLKQIYEENNTRNLKHNLQYQNTIYRAASYGTSRLKSDFLRMFNLIPSKKILLMADHSNHYPLFIGKVSSKKYKLFVGHRVSPLQAMALLLAHVQNN